jgi:CRP-like cAMP-binding protein
LNRLEREKIMIQGRILPVEAGTKITTFGEAGDSAFFILEGKTVAGISEGQGNYRSLSSMEAGDYFGEIAVLAGSVRTADVVAEEKSLLLQIPAPILKMMMEQPQFNQMVRRRMSERLARTSVRDLVRFTAVDPEAARQLRVESLPGGIPAASQA